MSFTYDYMGRRVRKVNYYNGDVNEMTRVVYDGQQVIAEYDYNDTTSQYELARKFIHGDGIDQPICMINSAAPTGTYYYHYDGLGSVAALTDTAGNLKERYAYDVFGEVTIYDSSGNVIEDSQYDNPYYFTGRRYDKEADFYYYRARYYKPDIGRFLQTDRIHYGDGMNLYTYIRNNPVRYVDPYGLFGVCGTNSFGNRWWGPDGYKMVSWVAACSFHDDCYEAKSRAYCGISKQKCDRIFLRLMIKACQRQSKGYSYIHDSGVIIRVPRSEVLMYCLRRASLYYELVRKYGDKGYDKARQKNCPCTGTW